MYRLWLISIVGAGMALVAACNVDVTIGEDEAVEATPVSEVASGDTTAPPSSDPTPDPGPTASPTPDPSAEPEVVEDVLLYPVRAGEDWGYIDRNGDIVIEPQFDLAMEFYEGRAGVMVGPLWGFIDGSGQFIVEPRFEWVEDFSEGRALVMEDGAWGYIDRAGEIAVELRFDHGRAFSDGLAPVGIGDEMGGSHFYELINAEWSFINRDGELVIDGRFDGARSFSEGLAAVLVGDEWGYIDTVGELAIQPQFDNAERFSEGLAAVQVGELWGYIDPAGAFVFEPQFAGPGEFSEGLVAVHHGWGDSYFFDADGNDIFERRFDYAREFSEGLALAATDRLWGYIDHSGEFVIEPQYEVAQAFRKGLAAVWESVPHSLISFAGDGTTYIDPDGNVVWEPDLSAEDPPPESPHDSSFDAIFPPWDSMDGPAYTAFNECDRGGVEERAVDHRTGLASFVVSVDFEPPCEDVALTGVGGATFHSSVDLVVDDGSQIEATLSYVVQEAIGVTDVGAAEYEFRLQFDFPGADVMFADDSGGASSSAGVRDQCSAEAGRACTPWNGFEEGIYDLIFVGDVDCGGESSCSLADLRTSVSVWIYADEPPAAARANVDVEIFWLSIYPRP